MEPRSVLVSYALGRDSTDPFSGSGILLNEHWVLAHGSLLEPLMSKSSAIRDFVNNLKANNTITDVSRSVDFEISWDATTPSSSSPPGHCGKVMPRTNQRALNDSTNQPVMRRKNGRLTAAWKCELVTETLEGILSNWTFSEGTRKENFAGLSKRLLPLFLVFNVEDDDEPVGYDQPSLATVLRSFTNILVNPRRGENVEIESTPFGNPVFIHSVASGVVGNVVGADGSLLLTDANTVLGCEGGPIFIKYQSGRRMLCGMVIAPLSWCRGEWVGYTLGVNLLPCLRNILNRDLVSKNSFQCPSSDSNVVDLLDRRVIVVRCGAGWGSGILVDKNSGTVLTCSHVVQEAPNSRIKIHGKNVSAWADLIYRTPNNLPYDVALLKVDPKHLSSMESTSIATAPVIKGEQVFSAGFPLFSTVDQPFILPTVTRGNVSHVSAGMLQTTCCIQSGASGGPIVHPSGELLGIVVCNASSAGTNALFPHLNMAVPATVLKGPIEEYIRTKDVRALKTLENNNELIRQMWNLHLVSSKL